MSPPVLARRVLTCYVPLCATSSESVPAVKCLFCTTFILFLFLMLYFYPTTVILLHRIYKDCINLSDCGFKVCFLDTDDDI